MYEIESRAEREERETRGVTLAQFVVTILIQFALLAFFYGKLSDRVETIDRTTQQLLQLKLNHTSTSLDERNFQQ